MNLDYSQLEQASPGLFRAISGGCADEVAGYLDGAVAKFVCPVTGCSWLHLAAERNVAAAIEPLVRSGVDINLQAANGDSPLILSLRENRLPTTRQLLALGADPNIRAERQSPLHYAVYRDPSFAYVSVLLAHGADPMALDHRGMTALHYTARFGDHESTMALLWSGADPNFVALESRRTPLQEALRAGERALFNEMKSWLASHRAHQAIQKMADASAQHASVLPPKPLS